MTKRKNLSRLAKVRKVVTFQCHYCGAETERQSCLFNARRQPSARVFCSTLCCGLSKRKVRQIYKPPTLMERFLMLCIPEPNSGCWIWLGALNNADRPIFNPGKRCRLANRFIFELTTDVTLVRRQYVLHRCDNGYCVNPDHLFCGSQRDNMRDMSRKGRGGRGDHRGALHHNAKLTAEMVLHIRRDNRTDAEIAKEYDVTAANIGSIRNFRSWSWLLEDGRSLPKEIRNQSGDNGYRRAIRYGRLVERFSKIEIFQRDNWVCQLCFTRIDRSAKCPSPLSASIDHKIPLSLPGGDHTRANTQCAHLICNLRKQNRGHDQLLVSFFEGKPQCAAA